VKQSVPAWKNLQANGTYKTTLNNTDNNTTATSIKTAQIINIISTPEMECRANPTTEILPSKYL
jgi:ABC-type lipoprotein release transport system permease subunit